MVAVCRAGLELAALFHSAVSLPPPLLLSPSPFPFPHLPFRRHFLYVTIHSPLSFSVLPFLDILLLVFRGALEPEPRRICLDFRMELRVLTNKGRAMTGKLLRVRVSVSMCRLALGPQPVVVR